MPFDLVIRGGDVLDGTGAPAFRADVGVCDGLITAVGTLPAGPPEIDAGGKFVAPGLIDAHVHGDAAVFSPEVQLAALAQGVTTFVAGQDGISYAPASASALRFATRYFAAINGRHPHLGESAGVAELLDTYDGRVPLNLAYLLPHGTIRHEVMGAAARPATDAELRAMLALVEEGLDAGATGVSTGLEYSPGRHAELPELVAFAAAAGRRGLPYVSHLRGYEGRAAVGMAEAAAIGRASGAPIHVSHYHGPAAELLGLVEAAADVDLTYDSYPYLRGCTILGMLVLPSWVPAADVDAALAAVADRREQVERELPGDQWDRLTLAHVPSPAWAWTEGLTIADAAARAGLDPRVLCVDLLLATGLEAGCVVAQPPANDEESVRALLRHPAQVGGSDGIYLGGHPHPRGWGAFARFLGVHTRELGDWTWPEAIAHLSGNTARRFGLRDRGGIRVGMAADLFVFDPATVADTATFDAPRRPARGVAEVVVNGVPVFSGGSLTGALPGRSLRRSS